MSEGPPVPGSCAQQVAPPPRGFAEEEYLDRLARAHEAMRKAGVDCLLLTAEADIRWFSGFLTPFWQSPTRPWFLLVPAGGRPVAVIPSIGAACMGGTWVEDIRTWPAPRPQDDGVTLLADTLLELVGPAARLGLPMGPGSYVRMPLADIERLGKLLDGTDWVDVTALLALLRAVKSAATVDKIRHVCRVASRAFAALPDLIGPGTADTEVFRAFRLRCLLEGADDVPFLVGGAAPGGYGDIISPPSGRALERGDILILDTGCTFDGHFCDFDRNYAIGEPDKASRQAHRIAWEATEAGLAAARPGLRCEELYELMQRVLAPHLHGAVSAPGGAAGGGAASGDVGRLGHGLGIELTEPPSLRAGDRTELRAGMVITLEPGFVYAPGRAMVHEENVLITEHGCELLSERAPAQMPIVR